MFQKLLLAVTITFCLNLFLKVHLPSPSTTASNFQAEKTSTSLIKLLLEQGLSQNLLHLFSSEATPNTKVATRVRLWCGLLALLLDFSGSTTLN